MPQEVYDQAGGYWYTEYDSAEAAQAALAAYRQEGITFVNPTDPYQHQQVVPRPGERMSDLVPQPWAETPEMLGPPLSGGGGELVRALSVLPGAMGLTSVLTQPKVSVQPGSPPPATLETLMAGTPDIAAQLAQIAKILGLAVAALPPWVKAALVAGVAITAILVALRASGITGNGGGGNGGGGNGGGGPSRRPSGARDGSHLLQGPGVPEPRPGTYYKSWRTAFELPGTMLNGFTWFWALNDGRILSYGGKYGRSWVWTPKKPAAVLMRGGKTSLAQAVKAQRILDKMWRTVAKKTKQLKLA